MRLSISSSSQPRKSARFYLAAFVITSLSAVLVMSLLWRSELLADHAILEFIAPRPTSSDYYLSLTDANAIDGYIFLHDLEGVCSPLRRADVVLFGDSRLQFAFRGDVLKNFFAKRGMTYYVLGLPNGGDLIAQEILDRCDVRPRFAVVFETIFFTNRLTALDDRMIESSLFEALKVRMEFEWAFAVRRHLHQILPHPIGRDFARKGWIVYRAVSDGSWWIAAGAQRDIPATSNDDIERPIPIDHFRAAERFHARITAGGGELLLSFIPSRFVARNRSVEIAQHLGVPLLDPKLSNLRTADGVHLLEESADRFADGFTRLLDAYLVDASKREGETPGTMRGS